MNLNEFLNSNWGLIDIGAYLHGAEVNGLNIKERRNKKGLELFQHFEIIPRWDNLPNCPRCNGQLRKYVDRSRTVGWGLRCAANHRFQPTKNTFLERNPVREEEPLWFPAGRFAPECLDKQWVGPPTIPGHVPFRDHTQNIERCWRDLKSLIGPSTKENVVYLYLGEWMYRKNVLNRIDTFAGQMERFMHDIRRAYPGLGRRPMQLDIRDCDCHECEP
ncbi:hypothetical protein MML48_1g16812 [Holotrichia oblita]|uniref:Uncharacterized protein n=1 Tax=Holotrichia oblita TaxID=644536 RepID=A0ACB9TV68_HOLOL|nr:hypothetical protein MML48_1g16812 [Holotrichia oblita]